MTPHLRGVPLGGWSIAIFVAVATAGLLYLMLKFAARLPMDVPNARSLHARAIPRIGGVAMMLALLVASVLAWPPSPSLGVVIMCVAGVAMVSYFDDWRGLPVVPRLGAHLALGAMAILLLGEPGPLGLVCLTLALVWTINLFNFMDGSDGLAGGMALVGFLAYGMGALMGGDMELAFACLSVSAAALGFLVFNFPPARVFMGDAGSIPLGFLAGVFGYSGWLGQLWPAWFPVLVFSPFVVDASVTLSRRLLRRERIWQAHREHYYQRLVRMGWGHRRTALAGYALMLSVGGGALLLLDSPARVQWSGVALWCAIYGFLLWRVDRAWHTYFKP
ncbi:MAG: glycosyltransferase family 4 protein [Sulfurisoma sp.]|nr:glycosyltransferase family 4 protein [Sulfurisoma sp.]